MQLDSSVNQVDSEKLRIGQPAIVHFDAFPGIELKGTVMSVGAMGARTGRENYYVRSIPVRVDIHGGDPRIIPDLSASADVILGEVPNALRAPLAAVREQDGRAYVYLKTREGFQAREVKLGMRNEVEVAIESGLKAGDEILLGSLR
jgi:HlyD family secretion protein